MPLQFQTGPQEYNLKLGGFVLRSDQSIISASEMKLSVIPKIEESAVEVGS